MEHLVLEHLYGLDLCLRVALDGLFPGRFGVDLEQLLGDLVRLLLVLVRLLLPVPRLLLRLLRLPLALLNLQLQRRELRLVLLLDLPRLSVTRCLASLSTCTLFGELLRLLGGSQG